MHALLWNCIFMQSDERASVNYYAVGLLRNENALMSGKCGK